MPNRKYFASANSSEGFVNYFPAVFGGCRRLYVVLGGPGTGKSRFLKEVATRGRAVEEYYCSSDADSLDGVMIDGWLGLVDGTAPHTWRTSCVGAFEQNVNLGEFWDARLLSSARSEIEALSKEKAACYEEAYAFLRAIGETERGVERRLWEAVDRKRLYRAAVRLLRGVPDENDGKRRIGLCSAIGMKGETHFPTYEQMPYAFGVSNGMGEAWLLLGAIEEVCRERGLSIRVAPDPILPARTEAIEIEGAKLSFFASEGEGTLSVKRFFVPEKMRAIRPLLRAAHETCERLRSYAVEALSHAADAHFSLEDIYSAAMDFKAKEEFTEEFCKKIFE